MDTAAGRIRHARRRLAWTQADLAAAAGVGIATVKRAELGAVSSPRTVRALAAALRVRVEWLTLGEEPMTPDGQEGRGA